MPVDFGPIRENLTLGLDVGIASVGWGLIETDLTRPDWGRIVGAGVLCFNKAETPKGESLAAERRKKRGERHRYASGRRRMRMIRKLLCDAGFATEEQLALDALPKGPKPELDTTPWDLRREGLGRRLGGYEFARALLHIARHRGFKSTKKGDGDGGGPNDEQGKVLSAVAAMTEKAQGYTTIGEALAMDPAFAKRKRNKRGDYSHTVPRALLDHEVAVLFAKQREFGLSAATDMLCNAFAKAAFDQKPIQSSEALVGNCTFERTEKRAARRSPSLERFRYLSNLTRTTLLVPGEEPRRLDAGQIARLEALVDRQKTIKWKTVRNALDDLPVGTRFGGLRYPGKSDATKGRGRAKNHASADTATAKRTKAGDEPKDPEDQVVGDFTGLHALADSISSALGVARWQEIAKNEVPLDQIAFILSFNDDLAEIRVKLLKSGLPDDLVTALTDAAAKGAFKEFTKAGHLSSKAARAINAHLREGLVYSAACKSAGYDHSVVDVPAFDEIPNPVVQRATREALAQVRAIVRKWGLPGSVVIETARDLGKSFKKREEITDELERHKAMLGRLRAECAEILGSEPSDDEFLAWRLWKEQLGKCLYTDDPISPHDLRDGLNKVQIDHILPHSRSFDSRYTNLALCTTTANQQKLEQTPFEWFGADTQRWHAFKIKVEGMNIKGMKKRNLLIEDYADQEKKFLQRNLTDTRYISRLLIAHLGQIYRNPEDSKRRVFARPGGITDTLRKAWGLNGIKKRADGSRVDDDRHHTLDALIVAAGSEAAMQRMISDTQRRDDAASRREATRQALREIWTPSPPWPAFATDVRNALAAVFVVRLAKRRGRGAAHDATIRRIDSKSGRILQRIVLQNVTGSTLERLVDKDGRNRSLYQELKTKLEAAGGKAEKAFPTTELLYRFGQDGQTRQVVRAITVETDIKSGLRLPTPGAIASNGDMVRVDVFEGKGKFFVVPVYVHHLAGNKPPPRAAVAKDLAEDRWPQVDDSHTFKFSLWPDDYVVLEKANGQLIEGYYRSTHRGDGRIYLASHLTRSSQNDPATKTARTVRKYQVDRLGGRFEIKREPRLWRGGTSI